MPNYLHVTQPGVVQAFLVTWMNPTDGTLDPGSGPTRSSVMFCLGIQLECAGESTYSSLHKFLCSSFFYVSLLAVSSQALHH